MYFASYLQTATDLLKNYSGHPPFHQYLKNFFKQHKKYGSTDRKQIAQFCYAYYRVGKAMPNNFSAQRFAAGLWLTSTAKNLAVTYLESLWPQRNNFSLQEKINFLQQNISFNADEIFDFAQQLSISLNIQMFQQSHLIQPAMYLRIRPSKKEVVFKKLAALNWLYEYVEPNTIKLSSGYAIEQFFNIDEEVCIQDMSSQQVKICIQKAQQITTRAIQKVWDVCAASGGKSILVYDTLPSIQLTVSDVRQSIIQNLHGRLNKAGIKKYNTFVLDVTQPSATLTSLYNTFDLVIADVPCSGSGTWSRTPEQLVFFNDEKIHAYAATQHKILQNILPTIKPDGYLLYCTCSVFKTENEDQIAWLQQQGLQLVHMQYLEGYSQQADTLFAALLQKSKIAFIPTTYSSVTKKTV
jgi:16S rRNA (cytosine967-C5)-methyltransferase